MIEQGASLHPATAMSMTEDILLDNLRPIERFLIALKAPETKRQYPKRLESFFDFLHMKGSLDEKTVIFNELIRQKESEWFTNQLLKFLKYQKERVLRKEYHDCKLETHFQKYAKRKTCIK